MKLSPKTIEKLAILINEGTVYRSGPKLVDLFGQLGFRDVYGAGFPSRLTYTKDRLTAINGRPELDKCIRMVFAPIEFADNPSHLGECMDQLNQELQFDGWEIVWDESIKEVSFKRVTPAAHFSPYVKGGQQSRIEPVDVFLKKEFAEINLEGIITIPGVLEIVNSRLKELKSCIERDIPLSAVILAGSILEAVFLSVALAKPEIFVSAKRAPKKGGQVMPFQEWRLVSLIDVAAELGFVKEDIYRFCHDVRDFRNFVHPFQQHAHHFTPDRNTAKICFQVVRGAIDQVQQKIKQLG